MQTDRDDAAGWQTNFAARIPPDTKIAVLSTRLRARADKDIPFTLVRGEEVLDLLASNESTLMIMLVPQPLHTQRRLSRIAGQVGNIAD
ncbi:hypothetical protein [Mycobacterium sp. URHB0021]